MNLMYDMYNWWGLSTIVYYRSILEKTVLKRDDWEILNTSIKFHHPLR